jgi:hypothetical protein
MKRLKATPVEPANGPPLRQSVISAIPWQGLRVQTIDGRHATLAILDDDGRIIESGDAVLEEAFNVSILAYRNFLIGQGTLKVISSPDHLPDDVH